MGWIWSWFDIDRNSTASVDRLVVSGNGRGIYVGRGSSFSGGWKDEDDTTLPTYMIEIKDNKKWGLEVQKIQTLILITSKFQVIGKRSTTMMMDRLGMKMPQNPGQFHRQYSRWKDQ